MQEAEIKEALAKRLRRSDIENLWTHLLGRRYVAEVLEGMLSVDGLVAEAQEILEASQPSRTKVETVTAAGPEPGAARSWALSMLVAAEAEQDDFVIGFRRTAFGGGTLTKTEAAEWIEHHADTSRPLTRDVTITVDADQVEADGWVQFVPESDKVRYIGAAVRTLDYAGADGEWVRRVPVPASGQLDQLRGVAEILAKRYCWQPAQATTFVLTGAIPLISRIRVTTRSRIGSPWADRVVLDIDPAESPGEVARVFAAAVRSTRQARSRPVKEKHALLAVHALVEHADLPWKERTRLWNIEHPDWRYSDSNYRRDALDTRNRLLRMAAVGGRGSDGVTH